MSASSSDTDRYAPVPSVVTIALTWPPLTERCMGETDELGPGNTYKKIPCDRAAVVTGRALTRMHSVLDAAYDARIALCLDHAARHAYDLEPDPGPDGETRVIPDLGELVQAKDTARWMTASPEERVEIASKDDCPVTAEQIELGERTGLPRPMVSTKIHLSAFSDATRDLLHDHGLLDKDGHYPARLPAVYIGGHHPVVNGDFFSFRDDTIRLIDERVCCICGDALNGRVALAAASGKKQTSGGWGHPRCIVLAVRTCPHFTEPTLPIPDQAPPTPRFETVAYRWDGPGTGCVRPGLEAFDDIEADAEPLTWAELRAWAAEDPWGDA